MNNHLKPALAEVVVTFILVVMGNFSDLWVYIVGPLAVGAIAVGIRMALDMQPGRKK